MTSTSKPNITLQESRALKTLWRDSFWVILTPDKGATMVVMDRQDYIRKAQELIGDQDTLTYIHTVYLYSTG